MGDMERTIGGPVSYVVTRKIKPGAKEQYEKWLSEVGGAARSIDPDLGVTVIESGGSQSNEYVVVFHFSSHEKLDEWEKSPERKELRRKLSSLEEGKAKFSEVTGFEYWFSLPKVAAIKPPARYKIMLVTMLGLYILSIIYYYTLNLWVEPWPDHLEIILKIIVLVTLMTLIIMPLLTRLFARWLYPPDSRGGH